MSSAAVVIGASRVKFLTTVHRVESHAVATLYRFGSISKRDLTLVSL